MTKLRNLFKAFRKQSLAPKNSNSFSSGPIKLNVGGGKGHPHVDGWLIVDLRDVDIVLDITSQPLPFSDNSVDIIFTSHTLEHIYPQKLGYVLDEFYRVLKPKSEGGLLRILVPDIELACKAYAAKDMDFFHKADLTYFDPKAPIGGLLASWFYSYSAVGEGHVHCFDYEYLTWWLNQHGFNNVWRSAYRQSILPELRGEAFDRRPEISLCVEAQKSS